MSCLVSLTISSPKGEKARRETGHGTRRTLSGVGEDKTPEDRGLCQRKEELSGGPFMSVQIQVQRVEEKRVTLVL